MRWAMLALFCASMIGCSKKERDLRGHYERSADGRSYFVLDEGKSCPLILDGKPWTGKVGEPEPLAVGVHSIECRGTTPATGFEIRSGRVFHFEYWGP